MDAEVFVLASGSKGNCTFVSDGTTSVLIDVGISCKKVESLLAEKNISMSDINAILITHEHTDHIMGLRSIDAKYGIPIYTNQRTARSIDIRLHINTQKWVRTDFESGFKIGNIEVIPFRTSHDAVSPVGYTLILGDKKFSYVTDLGYVTQGVFNVVKGSDVVVLESNHDLKMLTYGRYPLDLQARIKSNSGHLSNVQASETAVALAKTGTKCFILAHLSEENNTPELAWSVMYDRLTENGFNIGQDVFIVMASQNNPTPLIKI